MEALTTNSKVAKEELTEKVKEEREIEAREEAMAAFRLTPAYQYIMKSLCEKLRDVTDTRILAKNFGKIKSDVAGDIGVLGVASLMAAFPLEEMINELNGDS
jgi:hypothetical protein